ncbi:hypothetical protein NEOLEDRAFT_1118987 [Neolentinus lepideus HHB14362 ss-1]|uniref:A-kinase anchor protein 7-like phosphoesterase domain-containing protein n=1 Tax=Neolentinus lepideus HHB14362 ss-1 TaxID=1314782 RepID=A0A165QU34_9AGAM|nr:hypothetical protein NEOLEDRAFT_1118987 [Neolentinus lepideus HHB14362 ss-1]
MSATRTSATSTVRGQGLNQISGTGRGRGRGSGGWGRGRGRGEGSEYWRELRRGQRLGESDLTATGTAVTVEQTTTTIVGPSRSRRTERTPKPPLTHFIALPIGHHARLRESMSTFTQALLAGSPPVTGLDRSIIINPRRLHLTLGVMSLERSSAPGPKTIAAALALLAELRPRIFGILAGEKLRVELKAMDIMKPDKGDPERAHVMWVGPSNNGSGTKLQEVCLLVQRAFVEAGLLIDQRRELKLHCTIINTVQRKPRTNGPRTPFSYPSILGSVAFRQLNFPVVDLGQPGEKRKFDSITVDFGSWNVDEIQICEMGSHGPEDEYVSVGGITL